MLYLGLLFAHGTIVRHRQVTYRRREKNRYYSYTYSYQDQRIIKKKKVKKICRHGHLPARLNLPAWPYSQSQFAGMPATAGDLAPMLTLLRRNKNIAIANNNTGGGRCW